MKQVYQYYESIEIDCSGSFVMILVRLVWILLQFVGFAGASIRICLGRSVATAFESYSEIIFAIPPNHFHETFRA